jgi:hypothetical protein
MKRMRQSSEPRTVLHRRRPIKRADESLMGIDTDTFVTGNAFVRELRYSRVTVPKSTRTYWNPLSVEHRGEWQAAGSVTGTRRARDGLHRIFISRSCGGVREVLRSIHELRQSHSNQVVVAMGPTELAQFSGLVVIDERCRAPLTKLLPNRPNVG